MAGVRADGLFCHRSSLWRQWRRCGGNEYGPAASRDRIADGGSIGGGGAVSDWDRASATGSYACRSEYDATSDGHFGKHVPADADGHTGEHTSTDVDSDPHINSDPTNIGTARRPGDADHPGLSHRSVHRGICRIRDDPPRSGKWVVTSTYRSSAAIRFRYPTRSGDGPGCTVGGPFHRCSGYGVE